MNTVKYESTARPLLSAGAVDKAVAAGALIEYTACGVYEETPDTYDMPVGDGGWLTAHMLDVARSWAGNDDPALLVRAWYPLADSTESTE